MSAVSLSDSPFSTDEPLALSESVSAERRFAASSNDDDVRVDDSKKTFTTSRPRSVGSFFDSRACESANERAVASSRSTSSRPRSATESRWRRSGARGGSSSPGTTCRSVIDSTSSASSTSIDAVDLVDLDELHLDALVARGGQVLADVVGPDRQLAVAAVGEDGELHARGPAVLEQRVDRGADRAARVEDVVDEDHGASLELEVELGVAHDRLRPARRLAAADVDVVAVEGDVELAEVELQVGALGDQAAQPMGERHAARVDPDERDGARAPRCAR